MAKSLRSKWKRKMRQVKRERYGKKELDRLKKTLGIEDKPGEASTSTTDATMTDLSDVITFTTADEIKKKRKEKEQDKDIMDQSTLEDLKKFNAKTLMDANGAYPVWVHPRKIKKSKKSKDKKGKKSKGKVSKNSKKK
uniref:Protein LLP homolog n=1 Tax=Diabrotica virgifera virgifera TaxID=50390 RepID=A0A6P7F336_DIAVI